jgi:hypothetical protein
LKEIEYFRCWRQPKVAKIEYGPEGTPHSLGIAPALHFDVLTGFSPNGKEVTHFFQLTEEAEHFCR